MFMINVRKTKKEKMEHEEGGTAILRMQTHSTREKREKRPKGTGRKDHSRQWAPHPSHPCQHRLLQVLGFAISAENDLEVMTSPRGHLQPGTDWKILKASPLYCHSCFGAMVCNRNRTRAKYVM